MDNDQIVFLERSKISCAEVEELIDYYIDEEMTLPLKIRYEQHLQGCPACQELVDDCIQLVSIAQSLRDQPIPHDVSVKLRETLKERVGYEIPANNLLYFPKSKPDL